MEPPRPYREAFERWGYLADAQARKYGLPNGATLLAKIAYVETRFSRNLKIESSAGARGPMQFEPATREAYVKRYGVDPWASIDEAVHAAGLFMKSTGLSGYNPGSSSYISEVLRAPVSIGREGSSSSSRRSPARGSAPSSSGSSPTSSSGVGGSLMHFLVTGALVLGGAAIIGLGVSRAAGSSAASAAAERLPR